MNKKILLSVIIPCYNCEDYIYDCIQSVYQQIDDSVEVIIVNDGSTDDSLRIINAFITETKKNSFTVISQENQGLSAARNTGIKLAIGSYIALLDGDDLWDETFWKTIKPIVEDRPVDIIEFNANRFYNGDKDSRDLVSIVDDNTFIEVKTLHDLSHVFKKSQWFAWARVYKRELFSSICFPTGMRYEDIATVPLLYHSAKNIISIKDELILYRVREGSITSSLIPGDIDDLIKVMSILNKISTENSPHGLAIIKPSMIMTFKLMKRISTHIHGYCFFNDQQIIKIKAIIPMFMKGERFGFYIKTLFLKQYCLINGMKYKFKNRRAVK